MLKQFIRFATLYCFKNISVCFFLSQWIWTNAHNWEIWSMLLYDCKRYMYNITEMVFNMKNCYIKKNEIDINTKTWYIKF